MTPQEALRHFEEHLCKHCCEWDKSLRHCNTCPTDTAKKSLEKQIPMRPIEYEDKFYACPVCGNPLLHKWEEYPAKLMSKDKGLPYCLGCGQQIDWSDDDD